MPRVTPTVTNTRARRLAALLAAAGLAACTAGHRAPTAAGAADPASATPKEGPAGGATPSLSDLYPSLGDEETAPPPSEVEQEEQAEEQFIGSEAVKGLRLDPRKLAAEFDIPIEVTPLVEQFIVYFQTQGREWYATWLARSTRYLPMMKRIFRENGLPEDMTYIAMIESGFSPRAWSRAKACGPWQFIRETGAEYGLSDDWWVDERRDPELATRAAAAHFKDLYEEFGDWYLAAAAYNAGAAKIERAIALYHTRNFWELAASGRYLRRETKHYVPKLIAAAIIAKHPVEFGFTGIDYLDPIEYESVSVPDATDLRVVAECAGADYDSVVELNPGLKRFCTPPGPKGYEVRVPSGTADTFEAAYAELDPTKRVTFRRHTVAQGDTLATIARRYGTDASAILRMNNLSSAHKVRLGADLVIPVPAGSRSELASLSPPPRESREAGPTGEVGTKHPLVTVGLTQGAVSPGSRETRDEDEDSGPVTPPPNRAKISATLEAGDTLWGISQRYGVSVNEIKRWNGIHNHRAVQAGTSLTLYVKKESLAAVSSGGTVVASAVPTPMALQLPGTLPYTVKRGDTVWEIAKDHNVDPMELLKDNGLSRHSKIRPGDVLAIPRSQAAR